jgi:DNA-binding CsgD family transcriptional regulator
LVPRAIVRARRAGDAEELARVVEDLEDAPWFAAMVTAQLAGRFVDDEAVRAPLRDAVATFDAYELNAQADACRALLRQAGVPVPRRTTDQAGVPDQLKTMGVTARELDVLRLVAEGLTSREVGERLYLSPRTVEKHVERLMVKTGSVNRAALAALAAQTDT